jgi:hypothetical protein
MEGRGGIWGAYHLGEALGLARAMASKSSRMREMAL